MAGPAPAIRPQKADAPQPSAYIPRFVIEPEPWFRQFIQRLRDAFSRDAEPPLILTSRPGVYWHDVFVLRPIPWDWISRSAAMHAAFLLAVFLIQGWIFKPTITEKLDDSSRSITYYEVSEYLPPVKSASKPAGRPQKADPKYARQEVVSLPPEPDNFNQSIFDKMDPEIITREVPLPNITVWSAPAAVPVVATQRQVAALVLPADIMRVVAPAPQVSARNLDSVNLPKIPEPSVLPPPEAMNRKVGDINLAALQPAIEAPALPMPEQRATLGEEKDAAASETAPAPPSAGSIAAGLNAAGQLMTLSLNPVPPAGTIQVPEGSRSGEFAVSPTGTPDALGAPGIMAGGEGPGGKGTGIGGPDSGAGSNSAGIMIGPGPNAPKLGAVVAMAPTVQSPGDAPPPSRRPGQNPNPNKNNDLQAAAKPRSVEDIARNTRPPATDLPNPASDSMESRVFGGKRYYSLTLSMPNLNSRSGSYLVKFAELGTPTYAGELSAPSPVSKVDPAYPAEMMRMNIEGEVLLYAVIQANGAVSNVRILRGFDERLDENARTALARWIFRPATKHGQPVALEAIFTIPFVADQTRF